MDKKDYITIYCPKCKRKVGSHNPISQTDTDCRCQKCDKRVVYRYRTRETEITDRPPRKTAGGLRFF
jgi:DNA-directed RNA polymerase subunit RPC12/RpoP